MGTRAIYPGSFDPITNGHVDIIERGLKVFGRIVVAVLENPKKAPFFTTKERMRMIQDIFAGRETIEVRSFDGLLVDFARARRRMSSSGVCGPSRTSSTSSRWPS
jgi:pantetheine-phosphate adenylyltransferase